MDYEVVFIQLTENIDRLGVMAGHIQDQITQIHNDFVHLNHLVDLIDEILHRSRDTDR